MTQWIKKSIWLCVALTLVSAGNLFAQEDHYIENQRYVAGINDFAWGNTFVGGFTSTNGLIVEHYISGGSTNDINLSVDSLQIGTTNNSGNYVDIFAGGTLAINGSLSILNTNAGEGLTIHDQGTLFMQSDFDASINGFQYNAGAQLLVGGSVTNLDNVEDGLNFTLTGDDATWNFASSNLVIGATTDANSVSISNDANFSIENILVGSAGTVSNRFIVSDGGRAFVQNNITNLGVDANSFVLITNSGILAIDFDFDADNNNVVLEKGGILEAHQNLTFHGITNGGGVIMTGTNANWSNLAGSTLLIGPSTDENTLTITDGATVQAGGLQLGSTTNKDNKIFITDDGNLILGGIASIVNDTNELWVTEGGKITFQADYNLSTPGSFFWGNGGILEAQGEAPAFGAFRINDLYDEFGRLFLNNGKTLILNGPSARWSTAPYNLHIGDLSADNHLIITNGGQAFANSASIGDFKVGNNGGEGGNRNSLLITGTNSLLDSTTFVAIGGTIDSGNWIEGGTNNSITVDNAGQLLVGTTLHNRNTTGTSGLTIKPGGVVDAQDYYQADGAYLSIYTDASGTNSGLLRVANTAEFEAGAEVGFDAVAALAIGQTYTNTIVESGTLVVGGVTNATTSDLDALENTGGSLVNYSLWETNQNILATFTRRAIADGGGITDALLTQISDEIDRLAGLPGNSAASNQVAILSGLSSAQVKAQMEQMYLYQTPTYQHNQGVFGAIDQVRARGSSFRGTGGNSDLPRPDGVSGPHAADQELQGWAKVFGSYGNRDSGSDFDDGYDVNAYGTVLGLDQAFGDWLFGLAGGYAMSTIDGDNGDESDADTVYGMLYASYGTEDWFGDLVVSYGTSDIENDSGTAFGVSSDVDAAQTAFYAGIGKEFKDPEGSDALLRPVLGLQVSQYDQDAYTEKSTMAVAKDVDAFDRWSYQSTLGATMVLPAKGRKVDYETQLRAFWLHEFNDDAEEVDYTLIGSGLQGQFILRSPESDVGQFGIGLVTKCRKSGLQLRADVDGQVSGDFFSITASGALLYEF